LLNQLAKELEQLGDALVGTIWCTKQLRELGLRIEAAFKKKEIML